MEDFLIIIGHFYPRGAHDSGSRAYTLPPHVALESFNETNDDCNVQHLDMARRGVHTVTMLIRVRDLQLIAHREWKPADLNQAELTL